MCISPAMFQLGGNLLQGIGGFAYNRTQADMARADAAAEADVGQAQAERILRATARRRGEARAATAASGARIDAFSLANEQDILQAGETDAAMAILGARRRGDALRVGAKMSEAAGWNELSGSLLRGAYNLSGWKGVRQPAETSGFNGAAYRDPRGWEE